MLQIDVWELIKDGGMMRSNLGMVCVPMAGFMWGSDGLRGLLASRGLGSRESAQDCCPSSVVWSKKKFCVGVGCGGKLEAYGGYLFLKGGMGRWG